MTDDVVAHRIETAADVGVEIILVPVGEIDRFANAMHSALQAYPDISQLAMDRFSGEQVADRYLALIEADS